MKAQIIQLLQQLGTGLEYSYEDLEKISDISTENTIETIENNQIVEKRIDWTTLYGELGERKI